MLFLDKHNCESQVTPIYAFWEKKKKMSFSKGQTKRNNFTWKVQRNSGRVLL